MAALRPASIWQVARRFPRAHCGNPTAPSITRRRRVSRRRAEGGGPTPRDGAEAFSTSTRVVPRVRSSIWAPHQKLNVSSLTYPRQLALGYSRCKNVATTRRRATLSRRNAAMLSSPMADTPCRHRAPMPGLLSGRGTHLNSLFRFLGRALGAVLQDLTGHRIDSDLDGLAKAAHVE